jgi:isoquinoline 1-oxidoreductase alpha subunit
VLINDQVEHSCVYDVSAAVGKRVVTIEGLSADRSHPAQQAWIANQVPQCGYCQPGMLMCAAGQMKAGHHGSDIASEMKNLCVCGTYLRIKQAVAKL